MLFMCSSFGGAGVYPPSQTSAYIQTDSDSKCSITLLYDHRLLTSEAFAHLS